MKLASNKRYRSATGNETEQDMDEEIQFSSSTVPESDFEWFGNVPIKMEEDVQQYSMETESTTNYNQFTEEEIMNFLVPPNKMDKEKTISLDPHLRATQAMPFQPVQSANFIPQAASQFPSPSSKQLQEVEQVVPQIDAGLQRISMIQKDIPLPIRKEAYTALEREQRELKNAIDWADKQLNTLLETSILEANEMHLLLHMQQSLFEKMKQLELYNQELLNFQKENSLPCIALVILSQPFPESVKQHKSIEEPVIVRLLTGAKCDIKPECSVRAEIINFNSGGKTKKNSVGLENAEQTMNENGISRFSDLKFPYGTRLKSVRIKFNTKINVSDSMGQIHGIHVESNPSNPIVVKTNENQWYEAEGILLQKAVFGNQAEITWQKLANWLQRRYLMATRQSVQTPIRPLTQHDFNYLHKLKFDGTPMISQKDFEKFWEWCGPLFHKIRYQRHLCSLWTQGYICGFLTREEVDTVLKGQPVGTFLIRFSDRMPKFVVSYQATDSYGQNKVKHYLLKADDTHGAKKTLPDFLNSYRELECILQLWTDRTTNKRILRRCDKDTVLKEYYSKKSDQAFNGYEDDIQTKEL